MKRLSAIDLQERLRGTEPAVLCVTRRRAPSVDDVVRRLDAAARRLELELFAVDGDDGETAALLPDLGVTMIPCVLVVSGGVVLERQCAIRDGVDARRIVALAAAGRTTRPPGPALPDTLPPARGASSSLSSAAPSSSPPASSVPSSSPPASSVPSSSPPILPGGEGG